MQSVAIYIAMYCNKRNILFPISGCQKLATISSVVCHISFIVVVTCNKRVLDIQTIRRVSALRKVYNIQSFHGAPNNATNNST